MNLKIYTTYTLIKDVLQEAQITDSLNQDIDIAITNSLNDLIACKKLNIPTIALIDNHHILEQAIEIGISDYLWLPLNPNELKSRIKLQNTRNKIDIDPLTGIYNRSYLDTQNLTLDLSMIMIDLDNFKSINDKYGHIKGDDVLKNTVQAMKQSTRTTDILIRFGGDEFIILLPKTKLEQAKIVAERTRNNITNILSDIGGTASLGIVINQSFDSIEDFIHRADQALYRAKKMGKNQVSN